MKGVYMFIFIYFEIFSLSSQTWVSMPNCPRKLDHCVSFGIGSKFYVGTGYDSIYGGPKTRKFFSYDVLTNIWDTIPSFPDSARCQSVSFVINNKAYVGFGNSFYTCFSDLYEYDPISNTWAKKASCPVSYCAYLTSSAFSLNGKGYVITAADNAFPTTSVFQYDPISDTWIQKNNFPGTRRCDAMAWATNKRGYFGLGRVWNPGYTPLDDIWEYNDSTDAWALKTVCPNGKNFWTGGVTHKNEIYTLGGAQSFTNSVSKYNPLTNTWTGITNMPFSRHDGHGYSYDCNIYVGSGCDPTGNSNSLIKLKVDSTCLNYEGIFEISYKNSTFYPNPNQGKLYMSFNRILNHATVRIINEIGIVICEEVNLNQKQMEFNLTGISDGIYFVEIEESGCVERLKFLKN